MLVTFFAHATLFVVVIILCFLLCAAAVVVLRAQSVGFARLGTGK